MSLISQIEELAQPIANTQGAYLIDVKNRWEGKQQLIDIFVDTDEGVTIDLCAQISRQLIRTIDNSDIMKSPYRLQVSSPGIDRPLKFSRQYQKHIGRQLSIQYNLDGSILRLTGELIETADRHITIRLNDGTIKKINRDEIIEACINPVW